MIDLEIAGSVARLTLRREPVNAMNDAWMEAFHACLDRLEESSDWAVLHIRSGLKVFSAGADLKQLEANFGEPPEVQAEVGRRYQALFTRIESLGATTIAEIGGAALGGGLELALACDLRIVAREAKLGLPEIGLGLIPGAGGTQRLTLLCGRPQSLRLILGAELVDGEEAQRLGLAQWCVDRADLAMSAGEIVARFSALPRHAAAAAKACIAAAAAPSQAGQDTEVEQVRRLLGNQATKDLVGAFLARSAAK
ncbi:enoyl-CoA hydratase/isomerase family protein [Enterovirga aerilata]|uniref:Enoyl-CoA hydratase/isomerase family protein n=1 Tax=Enterovirga aerilata TaxID=2730920 RepID=A0A849IDK6_9HYPH|nr:enoyl-CoA hydratase/isomerase family protein [Enterovirga sp. DB1703]NNM74120.1 enoyl-CoA hydratase/isomerase family protein [Enterovirga sp. DB1703]